MPIVEAGMRTTATMVIGFDETLGERLEHLERTRSFQDACSARWTRRAPSRSSAGPTSPTVRRSAAGRSPRRRPFSVASLGPQPALYLDNIKHVRTSVLTQNEEAFSALDYGADDFDLPIEDEVTQKAGARIDLDLEHLLSVARSLGYPLDYRHAERPSLAAAAESPAASSRSGQLEEHTALPGARPPQGRLEHGRTAPSRCVSRAPRSGARRRG